MSLPIWQYFHHAINSVLHNQPISPTLPPMHMPIPEYLLSHLQKAWNQQHQIGWKHTLKGRISHQWEIAQKEAYTYYPKPHKKHHKASLCFNAVIQTILHGSLRLWKVRCMLKKGIDKQDQIHLQRSHLVSHYHVII